MSIKRPSSDLSAAHFYANQVSLKGDSKHSTYSNASHLTSRATPFIQPPSPTITMDRHPNTFHEFIELRSLPTLTSSTNAQHLNRQPIIRLHHDSIDVDITWCRQHWNDLGTAFITRSSKPIRVGDDIFCQKKYGNGRIVRMSRRRGRYIHFLVQFKNDDHGILTRDIAVPFSLVDLTISQRIMSLVSFMIRPFVYYHQCLP